ncbi:MAG TPA: hypothetical protein PLE48_02365 [Thiobacillus sp.]|nr:MAG: hypothetical protein B7X81_04740 [Hydrogenophilales bacterium 17-61-76]HQT30178.1 hypothetical protein [Thiobacillus sp.]HQT69251.1 hypothetical protein [Thiobacillus sp.]
MASKQKKTATPETKKFPRKEVQVFLEKGDSDEMAARKMTAFMTTPELAALRVMRGAEQKSGNWEDIDVPALMDQLRDQASAVSRGDLTQAEAMLMNQATALQSLFARLAERGMGCDSAPAFEVNMRMALRAQNQFRATLETLAAIKNPPVIFAKQANIANGQQQINNGAPSRALESESQQSKLLEAQHGEWLDTGTAGAAIGVDKAMAAVGEIDRAENNRG